MNSSPDIEVRLREGPLPLAELWRPTGAGAVVCFEGVVRPLEAGHELAALTYEVYEPMTSRELHTLAAQIAEAHALTALRAEHSYGQVPVGEASFRLRVAAPHRKAALAAMDMFIDRMKRQVPIWKVPVWAPGQAERTEHAGQPSQAAPVRESRT